MEGQGPVAPAQGRAGRGRSAGPGSGLFQVHVSSSGWGDVFGGKWGEVGCWESRASRCMKAARSLTRFRGHKAQHPHLGLGIRNTCLLPLLPPPPPPTPPPLIPSHGRNQEITKGRELGSPLLLLPLSLEEARPRSAATSSVKSVFSELSLRVSLPVRGPTGSPFCPPC